MKSSRKSVLVVIPHPDDEISMAGKMMSLLDDGADVHIVCLTYGEQGPYRNYKDKSKQLSEIRKSEFTTVCSMLGSTSSHHWDCGDLKSNDWDFEIISKKILDLIDTYSITQILTLGNQLNMHPDHLATFNLISNSFPTMNTLYVSYHSYSILNKIFWFFPRMIIKKKFKSFFVPDSKIAYSLRLTNQQVQKKITMMKQYKSQFPDESGNYYKMPLWLVKKYLRYECFQ